MKKIFFSIIFFSFFFSAIVYGQTQKELPAEKKETVTVQKNILTQETDIVLSEEELKRRQQPMPLEMKAYDPSGNNSEQNMGEENKSGNEPDKAVKPK